MNKLKNLLSIVDNIASLTVALLAGYLAYTAIHLSTTVDIATRIGAAGGLLSLARRRVTKGQSK